MYFLIFWGEQPNTSLLLTVYGYIPNKKEEREVSVQIFPHFVLESSATRHTCIRPCIIFDGKYCTCDMFAVVALCGRAEKAIT